MAFSSDSTHSKENRFRIRSILANGPLGWVDDLAALLDNVFDWMRAHFKSDLPLGLFLIAPAMIILTVFGLFPLGYAIYMSLYSGKWGMGDFVGLGNYAQALHSEDFWHSFLVTIYFAAISIPITLLFSFLAALGLFRILHGRGLFRTLYFLPYITSAVAAAMVWRSIFHTQYGIVNPILEWMGLEPQQWLLEPRSMLAILTNGAIPENIGPSLALCCVILFEIWHTSGFMIVVFLAGLTAIPRDLEEAARIDGANALQVARHVTLPLLSPTVFFLTIVSVIRSFQAFNGFYAMTGNGYGPLNTTQNMTVYIYAQFYEYHYWGYGAAVATLLCLAIAALTVLQWRLVGRRVYYR